MLKRNKPLNRTPFKSKRKPMNTVSNKKAEEKHPLRENAEGKHCALRLPGCRHDPDYTVLVHYRRFGWSGAGQKPVDLLGAFACDLCHEKQERHHPDATPEDMLRAMGETLVIQLNDGKITIPD